YVIHSTTPASTQIYPLSLHDALPICVVLIPMDLKTGRRGEGPCGRVVIEAFQAGQEPDKDCNGSTDAVSKLPYYLQKPFYQIVRSEEHTSELQSRGHLVCRLLLEKKK